MKRKDVNWYKNRIDSLEMAQEILDSQAESLDAKTLTQCQKNLAKAQQGNGNAWERLRNTLAQHLYDSQTPDY